MHNKKIALSESEQKLELMLMNNEVSIVDVLKVANIDIEKVVKELTSRKENNRWLEHKNKYQNNIDWEEPYLMPIAPMDHRFIEILDKINKITGFKTDYRWKTKDNNEMFFWLQKVIQNEIISAIKPIREKLYTLKEELKNIDYDQVISIKK